MQQRIKYLNVTCGFDHTCALRSDGLIICFGSNGDGQTLIPNSIANPDAATNGYLSRQRFMTVQAGWHHTCGIREGGYLACWGFNDYGQTDVPTNILVDGEQV